MVEKIHILLAYALEVVNSLYLHRLCLYPLAVLDVAALCRYLTDIDLRVEVCSERIAVVAAVAVEDINVVYLVELVLHSVS